SDARRTGSTASPGSEPMIGVRTSALALALAGAPLQANILSVEYRPDAVVDVAVAPGYATVIELERGEAIETVVVGDSDNWQISSNARGDQLVVKPKGGAGPTDLVVTSDRRRYAFNLTPQLSGPPAFVVHFQYAGASLPSAQAGRQAQQFRYGGSSELFPLEMRESGNSTLIRWKSQAGIPAVFAIKDDGSEILTNGRMVGESYVVDGTASRFNFRLGKFRTVAV